MSRPSSLVALVTGANRGIGLEVVRQLAQKGIHVILSARNPEKGEAAVKKLLLEGLSVEFWQLDITDEASVRACAEWVRKTHGGLDILVNNAGVLLDPSRNPPDAVGASIFNSKLSTIRGSLDTNTFGPLLMIQAFVPIMTARNYGRIVNISSGMGQLSDMNGGWPGYRISKLALNAVTKICADELKGLNILINSVCPGWVRTDMGGADAELTTSEGADTVVWAATLPNGGPSGGFFRERQAITW